jgi:hypothetical protein
VKYRVDSVEADAILLRSQTALQNCSGRAGELGSFRVVVHGNLQKSAIINDQGEAALYRADSRLEVVGTDVFVMHRRCLTQTRETAKIAVEVDIDALDRGHEKIIGLGSD